MNSNTTHTDTDRIRRTAANAAEAQAHLEAVIRDSYPGLSLRAIAAAAGISHEQVRRIVNAP